MAIKIKTPDQIEKIRQAGKVVCRVLDRLGEMISPGVTTEDLDAEARRLCESAGARCLFRGVPGAGRAGPFPGNICASINDEVVHGIPSKRRAIRDGDVVSVDFGVELDGWCGDAARTFCCGEVDPDVRRLVDVTRNALTMAIEMSRPGELWSTVARAMEQYVKSEGFAVVEKFVGHGIGRQMHEDPKVPNFVSPELVRSDIQLSRGLVIAVEPMVNMSSPDVEYGSDGWTIRTMDRRPSAHWEETIAIVDGGADVLTDGR